MGRFIIPDTEHGNITEEADTKESEDVNDAGDDGDFKAAGNDDKNDMNSSQQRKRSIKSKRKRNRFGGEEFVRKGVVSMQDTAKGENILHFLVTIYSSLVCQYITDSSWRT